MLNFQRLSYHVIMKKGKIEKLIRKYVRDNHDSEPGAFSELIQEIEWLSLILADTYWETRKKAEVKRDLQAGVTIQDYEIWVMAEIIELKKETLFN